MEGRAGEINEVIRMRELRDDSNKMFAFSTRVRNRGAQVVTLANVVRRLGLTEEQIRDDDVGGMFFGHRLADLNRLSEKSPQDLLNETISFVQRRNTQPTLIKDITGVEVELAPLVRIDLLPDRFVSDRNGVFDKQAENTLRARAKKTDTFFDEKNIKTHNAVMKETDRIQRDMLEFIKRRSADVEPGEVEGAGKSGDPILNITLKRSGRERDLEQEGIC